MSLSKYPNQFDIYQTKRDAEFEGDPNGDDVMADDVNALQDAIVAIEKSLGVNPQGNKMSVGDRIGLLEGSASLRVPSFLIYLGDVELINGSTTTTEAISEYLKYDHVVIGNNAEDEGDEDHTLAIDIINGTKESREVSFYGYIDCGVNSSNLSISQIQLKIQSWYDMGVKGIYCGNFGYENNVSRERQNNILDSIHQYGMIAVLEAEDPDQTLSDVYHETMNPDWVLPNIVEGDVFHFNKFAVDTSTSNAYLDFSNVLTILNKLYGYRKELGIKILGTPLIQSTIDKEKAQEYYNYGHIAALLSSLDLFHPVTEGYGEITNIAPFYSWMSIVGNWYAKTPIIEENNGSYTRQTLFGSITLNSSDHTYNYEGIYIPYELLKIANNTMDGAALKDYTIEDSKIKNYKGERLIQAINDDPSSERIKISKVRKFSADDLEGDISVDKLKANVISAINTNIGYAKIDQGVIGDLTAEHIKTGALDAKIIQSTVVDAINLYAQNMNADSAKINTATIGELTAEHIKASVVEAINLYAENMDANSVTINQAVIKEVAAEKITTGNIAADRMRANVVNAINLYADTIVGDMAKIKSAVIGELTAEHIEAVVISAINASIEVAKIEGAKIAEASITDAHIVDATITGAKIALATIDTANIKDAAIGTAQIDVGAITSALIAEAAVETIHIADGSITDAKILELNAGKINAGTINTAKVTIEGENGHLKLAGNRIQIFDNQETPIERVAIGDVNNDGTVYGLRVRGQDGVTILYDQNGIYNEGITDGAVTNPKIGDDAVDGRVIAAESVVAEHISSDAIIARHISTDAITTKHILAGSITAESAIIAEAAITETNIGDAQITGAKIKNATIESLNLKDGAVTTIKIEDGAITAAKIEKATITSAEIALATITSANIKELNADLINAGKIKAQYVEIGGHTTFEDGYDPKYNDDQVRLDLRLEAPLPSNITLNQNGIKVSTDIATSFVSLDYRGLYISGGAIVIDGGLPKEKMSQEVINTLDGSLQEGTTYNGVKIDGKNGITVTSPKNKLSLNATNGIKIENTETNQVLFEVTTDGKLRFVGDVKITGGSISWSNVQKPTYTAGEVGTYDKEELDSKFLLTATKQSVDDLTGRVSKNETKLSVQAGKIESKVGADYVDGAIDKLEIGGRNRIINSTFNKGMTDWTNDYEILSPESDKPTSSIIHIVSKNLTENKYKQSWSKEIDVSEQIGKPITISFDIKVEDISVIETSHILFGIRLFDVLGARSAKDAVEDHSINKVSMPELANGKWVRHSITFTPEKGKYLRVGPYLTKNGSVYWREIKAESGEKATDWTPAPEDVDYSMSSVESRITQTESEIASKVSIEEIGSMQSGELNIIDNSSFFYGLWPSTAGGGFTKNEGVTLYDRFSLEYVYPGGNYTGYPFMATDFIDVNEADLIGKTVTISSYVYVPKDATFNKDVYFELCGYENTSQTVNATIVRKSVTPTDLGENIGVWKRYSATATIPASTANGTTNYVRFMLRVDVTTPTGKEHFFYALPKVELGFTATNWMPSVTDGGTEQSGIVRKQNPLTVRYIKTTALGPNTVNSGFNVVSLSAMVKGTDVARGILPTSGNGTANNLDRATNGNTDTFNYATINPADTTNYGQWMQVDLGKPYKNLERIDLILYYNDARKYRYKIEVSEDGTTWTELYNTKKHGIYASYMSGASFFVNGVDSIHSMETNIVQQADQISMKVSKDGVISAINQTPETIQLQASKIALDGYVEAKHIKSLYGLNINNKFLVDNSGNVTFAGTLNGATGNFTGSLNVVSKNNVVQISNGSIFTYSDDSSYTYGKIRIIGGEMRFEALNNPRLTGHIYQDLADAILTFENTNGISLQAKEGGIYLNGNIHATSDMDMGNHDIKNVNHITINDPGPEEGIEWVNGNKWRIVEAPFAMGNSSGNFHIAQGGTTDKRRMLLTTTGNIYLFSDSGDEIGRYTGSECAITSTKGPWTHYYIKPYGGRLRVVDQKTGDYTGVEASGFKVTSTIKIKTNVKPLEFDEAKRIFDNAEIYTYHMKSDIKEGIYNNIQIGMIAETVPPELRSGESISSYAMISTLWGYVKGLSKNLEKSEKRINDLEEVIELMLKERNK